MTLHAGPRSRPSWHAAYDAQMALWRWYRTSNGHAWMRESCLANMQSGGRPLPDHTRELIVRLYDAEMGRLLDCDPLYVSESMCEVVDAARQSFQPEPLLETDLLTPRGFLFFAKPLHMADRYGVDIALNAASWSWEYEAKDAETAQRVMAEITTQEKLANLGPRIAPWEMAEYLDSGDIWPAGISVTLYAERDHYMRIGRSVREQYEDAIRWTEGVPVVPFHITPWHFNSTFEGNEVDLNDEVTAAEGWWTTLQTTFRLMQQRIAHHEHQRPDRAARHEAKRAGVRREPEVVVIRLRREQAEGHEPVPSGEKRAYSHRWIVGGHWRNQPYKREGIHRQIWISPYVKGPEDKPLIVRPRRVYQWDK